MTQASEAAKATEAEAETAPVFTRHHGRTVTIRDPMRKIVLPEPYTPREKTT